MDKPEIGEGKDRDEGVCTCVWRVCVLGGWGRNYENSSDIAIKCPAVPTINFYFEHRHTIDTLNSIIIISI